MRKKSNCLKIYRSCLFIAIFVFFTLQASSKSVTSYLNDLNVKFKYKISFSPNVTNKLTPTHEPNGNDLQTCLDSLLLDTGLEYKKVDDLFIVVRKPVKIDKYPSKYIMPSIASYQEAEKPSYLLKLCYVEKKCEDKKSAIKTNIVYDALTTLNIGFERAINSNSSLELVCYINPWKFSDDRKCQIYDAFEGGYKYWFKKTFEKFFISADLMCGYYVMSEIKFPLGITYDVDLHGREYKGYYYGLNVGAGYVFKLSEKFRVETSVSAGYVRFNYDRYYIGSDKKYSSANKGYFGPTKFCVALMYMF